MTDTTQQFAGYAEARAAIEAGTAKPHALWVLLGAESDRDGFALKPSPWEGPGTYQHVAFDSDYCRLIRVPMEAASLIKLAETSDAKRAETPPDVLALGPTPTSEQLGLTPKETRAREALKPLGYDAELGGGGCTFLSVYLTPNGEKGEEGVRVWATCNGGGGMPDTDDYWFCVYDDRGCDTGADEAAFMVDQDSLLPIDVAGTIAIEAARALLDGKPLPPVPSGPVPPPEGFESWTDGIAQGFLIKRFAGPNEAFIIYSDRDGQSEPVDQGGWAILAGVGNIDSAEFQRVLDVNDRDGLTAERALALAEQAIAAARAYRSDVYTLERLSRNDCVLIVDGLENLQPDAEQNATRATELAAEVRRVADYR